MKWEIGKVGDTLIGEETGGQFRMGGSQEKKLTRIL